MAIVWGIAVLIVWNVVAEPSTLDEVGFDITIHGSPTPAPTEMAAKCCDAGEPTVCEKPRKGGSGMFWPTPSTDNSVPKWVRESARRGAPSSPAPRARGGASGA